MSDATKNHEPHKLGELFATAICGNDILSSALYVSGIAIIFAGIYAPLVLILVALVLYFYKAVYTEVVEALPINGGAYNCLLNGSSKTIAAIAGIMTTLSYVATAVISAKVGIEYLGTVIPNIPVIIATIVLLTVFAVLVISGIKDSAKVAFGIFILHIITLVGFLVMGLIYYFNGESHFGFNFTHTAEIIKNQGGLLITIYLAFSASLLGVSGFESSANFVEEQKKGVFRKTLRNMLVGVAIFNPLIALVVLNSLAFDVIAGAKDFLLADATMAIGGSIFKYIVVADAFLVLSGAVLTSFVGVSGLLSRMAADNCLPNFLSKVNKKGSHPRIIISFLLLCSSILILTRGDLLSLAGVYTVAFLGVMSLFAFGNLILRETRTELKRTYRAPLIFVVLAFFATLFGIVGNIRINPNNLTFFELYFIPSALVVFAIIYQDYIIRFVLRLLKGFPKLHQKIYKRFDDTVEGNFVVFIHHVNRLYGILDYINRNETGWNITLVHCQNGDGKADDESFKEIEEAIPQLQKAGVFSHFRLKLMYKDKPFGPEVIDEVAKELDIDKNRILIGSIHHYHPYDYEELGGVRIIF